MKVTKKNPGETPISEDQAATVKDAAAQAAEDAKLHPVERTVAAVIGVPMVGLGIWMMTSPPDVKTSVTLSSCKTASDCVATVSADNQEFAIALLLVGSTAILVALLGVRFASLKIAQLIELGKSPGTPNVATVKPEEVPKQGEAPKVSGGEFNEIEPGDPAITAGNSAPVPIGSAPDPSLWPTLLPWTQQAVEEWVTHNDVVSEAPANRVLDVRRVSGEGNNSWFVTLERDDGQPESLRVDSPGPTYISTEDFHW